MAFTAKEWSWDLNSDLSHLESYKVSSPQQVENRGPTSLFLASDGECRKCVTGEADPPLWTWEEEITVRRSQRRGVWAECQQPSMSQTATEQAHGKEMFVGRAARWSGPKA